MDSPYYAPYAPPAAPPAAFHVTPYRPFDALTKATIVALVATVPLHFALEGVRFAAAEEGEARSLYAFAQVVGALAVLVAALVAAVLFLVWFHRAASNVRAFGHEGLEYTPGWCVGWWFVPFANLVTPLRAMQEVWRASDPEAIGTGYGWEWRTRPAAAAFGSWWGAWIVSKVLGQIAARMSDPHVHLVIGMGAALASGAAVVHLVPIIRELARRQEVCWTRLTARADSVALDARAA